MNIADCTSQARLRMQMHGIGKRFPGVQALRDVALTAQAGKVHALFGENGAGKSTLIHILAGACAADSTIEIDSAAVAITSPLAARRAGISIVHQKLAVTRETIDQYRGWESH
jgi:ribose transport system ATP-binding protein